jgi:hypothetical protein
MPVPYPRLPLIFSYTASGEPIAFGSGVDVPPGRFIVVVGGAPIDPILPPPGYTLEVSPGTLEEAQRMAHQHGGWAAFVVSEQWPPSNSQNLDDLDDRP